MVDAQGEREKASMIYTQKEVAEIFGVTAQTVWRWRKAGKIKASKVGKQVLFTWDEISRLLDESTEQAQKE